MNGQGYPIGRGDRPFGSVSLCTLFPVDTTSITDKITNKIWSLTTLWSIDFPLYVQQVADVFQGQVASLIKVGSIISHQQVVL